VTFLNAEAERLTGWSSADAAGKPLQSIFRIIDERTRQPAENPVENVLREGAVAGLANHTILLAKDGREAPIDDSAAPIREGDGPVFGVVLVFRDVTERRRADLAQARLAAIVEFSGDAIVTKDLNGIVQTWNASAERLFGYRPDEIIGKSITMIIPPERLDEETQILEDLRHGRPHKRFETIRVAKNGRRFHVSLSVSPLKDSEGNVIGASKILHDITAVVVAREELARERELLATTLQSIGDGVIVTDAAGHVTFLNPQAEQLTGWSQGEAAGRPLHEVFQIVDEETRVKAENPVDQVLRNGTVVGLSNHTLLLARDNVEKPIDDSAAPIVHSDGTLVGVVLVFRDFTERRQAERALRASEEALQEESRRKDEFLAILSHELRNPLAPVRMAVSLMKKLSVPQPELQQLRDVIDRQTTQLTRLLDDLLEITRISSGKIALRKERFPLAEAISSAVESVRPHLDSHGHVLDVDLPSSPIYVSGDSARLSQVFANILNNAAKFTDKVGRILLTVRSEGPEAVIRVVDPGIGISSEQMPRIFGLFAQLDQSLERGQGGLGVGLALAKTLVELHGGRIEARSEGLGKGSEFVVRIPAADPDIPSVSEPTTAESPQKHRRILVADDNVDSATVLATLLRLSGHDVHTVHDGAAALEASAAPGLDLAILDIGMPRLNGYDVARHIRARGNKKTVLVAVTGWGQEDDRRRARDAGFDHHLTKPVDPSALEKILAELNVE
jgi:PAS domain S-box-containing protein